MAKNERWFVCDLKEAIQAQVLNGNVFSMDNNGSRIGVKIFDGGEKATVSGAITANCILPDGSTVNVNGTLTTVDGQSVGYIDVPQSCLLITGPLKITIKLTDSGVITTLAAILTTVYQTKTDNVITPSAQIINDWNAEISAAIATQNAAIANQDTKMNDLKSALAPIQNEVDGYVLPQFMLGNISVAQDGTMTWTAANYGAVTKPHEYAYFEAGTVVRITDNTDAKYACNLVVNDKVTEDTGWKYNDYIIPTTGYYVINIQSRSYSAQTSVDALLSLFKINNVHGISNKTDDLRVYVEGEYEIPRFVLGNIAYNVNTGVIDWQTDRKYGAITEKNNFAKLAKGTKVYLTDYSDAKFGLLYCENGLAVNEKNSGWQTNEYTVKYDGDYIINIQSKTLATQSSPDALAGLLRIKKEGGLINLSYEHSDDITILDVNVNGDYVLPKLVLGNVAANVNTGVIEWQTDRTYGVITDKDKFAKFAKGTKIYLSDYSDAKFGVVYCENGEAKENSGWKTGEYIIPYYGDYLLNIQSKTLATQSSPDALASLLRIEKTGGLVEETLKVLDRKYDLTGIKCEDIINNYFPQGACHVEDKFLFFNASNDAGTDHAYVYVYNADNLVTSIGSFEHNIGHCSSADYSHITDVLLVANGNSPAPTPKVFLVNNYKTKLDQLSDIELGDAGLTVLNLSSIITGAIGACFGETGDIIYVIECDPTNYDTNTEKKIFKLQLGYGANNMVSSFPSTSVGTYSYIDDNSPNGTAKILDTYTVSFPGEIQGMKFINGKVVVSMDTRAYDGYKRPYIVCIKKNYLKEGIVDKTFWIPIINRNGNVLEKEAEGIVFYNGKGYVTGGNNIFVFDSTQL